MTKGRVDALIAAGLGVCAIAAALIWPGERPLDIGGVLLIGAAYGVLAWRRRWPGPVMAGVVATVLVYNLLNYSHLVGIPAGMLALLTFSALARRRFGVLAVVFAAMSRVHGPGSGPTPTMTFATLGWVADVVIAGQAWRSHRERVAALQDRAEQEAQRRVAEERLRIARDLHDVLSQSITVIGVQTGAAAHLVAGDRPVDRAALADTLAGIAETCRAARKELRTTLQLLREPDLSGIGELVTAAQAAGIEVTLTDESGDVPVEVGSAAYRIVQEALTNVAKHAQARTAEVRLARAADGLVVTVADDGRGPAETAGQGFGVVGMTERARGVGGTLTTGTRSGGGFVVTAALPLAP